MNAHSEQKRRRVAALTVLTLAGCLLLAGPAMVTAQEAEAEERIEALEREVEELRALVAGWTRDAPGPQDDAVADETAAGITPEPEVIAELSHRIEVLSAEVERLSKGAETNAELGAEGQFGLAPAASKIYRTNRGLSVGGYGEMLYRAFDSQRDDGAPSGATDEVDFLRAILYFGYKFNDRIVFNSEIEVEHATTSGGSGEVSLEFAYIDYLWRPEINLRGGLLLVPMGKVNELHEPQVFLGANRPDVERVILPTTWRENGFGIFGEIGSVAYRSYLVNGFDASGFSAGGLRGGRQKGSKAGAEDVAWVTRVDYLAPGITLGGSLYVGGADQGLVGPDGRPVDVDVTLYEGHAEIWLGGLKLSGLYAHGEVDGVRELNAALGLAGNRSVGETLEGYYVEATYDLFANRSGRFSLSPYVRFESYDTQASVPGGFASNPANDVDSLTLGVSLQPIDQVMLKIDYQDYDNAAGTAVDRFNVSMGYAF